MKIPLLVHVRPQAFTKSGPLVYLLPGSWAIESNHKDSFLMVALSQEIEHKLENEMLVEGKQSLRVYIREPGSETHITVYARRLE